MKLETELKLSYYKEIADVDEEHRVKLVQHTVSGKVFVLKALYIYDKKVFTYLIENPSTGTPNIIEIIEDTEALYVIEEYISGNSLQQMLQSRGKLPKDEALEYVNQLFDILRPLHRQEPPIVHRDIKPSNLIITHSNNVVLIDFNSAKESEDNKSQDTVLFGTAEYAAPEQYGFSVSKPTADIYAIGVLLNEMMTGHLPNQESYVGFLEPIIRKCTQMDPNQRYQTVDELQQELAQAQLQAKFIPEHRSWLPPGVRSSNLLIIALSSLWYIFFIAVSLSIEIENVSERELKLNRVFFLLFFLLETFLIGNYQSIWTRLPLANSKNILVKIFGIVLWALILFVGAFILLEIVTIVIFH
ncbi:MAG: serine/threonine protein kinase [Clostridiales bacterium]|nr:serine/threonine protein kinase [Clostridiales bacterium]